MGAIVVAIFVGLVAVGLVAVLLVLAVLAIGSLKAINAAHDGSAWLSDHLQRRRTT